jgi:hypothetical protein
MSLKLEVNIIITQLHILYTRHGQYHKDNGPAVIFNDGSQYWYKNGNMIDNVNCGENDE